ncbi:hypothetical protein V8F20_012590 [Naviculisporaceae sp. PSN 640]
MSSRVKMVMSPRQSKLWTRALQSRLSQIRVQLENIFFRYDKLDRFFRDYKYRGADLPLGFLEAHLQDTTPAILRASKLHETIQRILAIDQDPATIRTETQADLNNLHSQPCLTDKDRLAMQARWLVQEHQNQFKTLLMEYRKILDREKINKKGTKDESKEKKGLGSTASSITQQLSEGLPSDPDIDQFLKPGDNTVATEHDD